MRVKWQKDTYTDTKIIWKTAFVHLIQHSPYNIPTEHGRNFGMKIWLNLWKFSWRGEGEKNNNTGNDLEESCTNPISLQDFYKKAEPHKVELLRSKTKADFQVMLFLSCCQCNLKILSNMWSNKATLISPHKPEQWVYTTYWEQIASQLQKKMYDAPSKTYGCSWWFPALESRPQVVSSARTKIIRESETNNNKVKCCSWFTVPSMFLENIYHHSIK